MAAVHQHEAARAVGVFHHARLGAELPEESSLLVAGNARDGYFMGEDSRLGVGIDFAGRAYLRHHAARYVKRGPAVRRPSPAYGC